MRDSYPNHFAQIYAAALKKDTSLLPSQYTDYCIDEFKQGHDLSAAAQLALEGEQEAAGWLIQQGANINYVAYGAARGGHVDYVEKLREQGANPNYIARGAAQGRHLDYAEKLRKQGANINWIAYGAARGGHLNYAEKLREQGADINRIAQGAAQGGHVKYAEKLREQGANSNGIAAGAAQGGHVDYAEKLLKQGADINWIAVGAALGGHVDYAEKLLKQGADINYIAQGAALGGHVKYAEKLREQGADINHIAQAAARGGHVNYAEKLREQGADINYIARGAAEGGFVSSKHGQLYFLSQFSSDKIRTALANAFSTLEKKPLQIETAIVKRAGRIARLRQVYGYSFSLALISTRLSRPQEITNGDTTTLNTPQKQTKAVNSGVLLMMASIVCCRRNPTMILGKFLPVEVLMNVFEYVFECPLNIQQFNPLGFLTGRSILIGQLEAHNSRLWFPQSAEKRNVNGLLSAVRATNQVTELTQHVSDQHQLKEASEKALETKPSRQPGFLTDAWSQVKKGRESLGKYFNSNEEEEEEASPLEICNPTTLSEIYTLWHSRLGDPVISKLPESDISGVLDL